MGVVRSASAQALLTLLLLVRCIFSGMKEDVQQLRDVQYSEHGDGAHDGDVHATHGAARVHDVARAVVREQGEACEAFSGDGVRGGRRRGGALAEVVAEVQQGQRRIFSTESSVK